MAAAVAASDATATIVVLEGEQGPSTSKEEGAAAAAAEATVATEQSEKEVNRKGVCVCVCGGGGEERSRAGHSEGRAPDRDLFAPTGTHELGGMGVAGAEWGGGGGTVYSIRSPPPSLLAAWRAGAGLGRGRCAGCRAPLSQGSEALEPLGSPQPPSHSRNWGNARGGGWGRAGTSLRLSLSSRSLSPSSRRPLPGKSRPFSPTLALKGFCWGLFFQI